MKKIILTLTLLFSLAGFAQTINGIAMRDIDAQYIQIVGTSKFMSTKLKVTIDIGQKTKLFSTNNDSSGIKDGMGNVVVFNSIMDALNFMYSYGFEFVSANIVTENEGSVYYYLMKRRS